MDNIETILLGIASVFLVQVGQTVRSWLVTRKSNDQHESITSDIFELKENVGTISKNMEVLEEKMEDAAFIPEFEIEMDTHMNTVLNGFTFNSRPVKSLASSIALGSIKIFTSIPKIGFKKFGKTSLMQKFDLQQMKLEAYTIGVDKLDLLGIIKTEQEAFLIQINPIIMNKSNGNRQIAFKKLCQHYIFNLIKEISTL